MTISKDLMLSILAMDSYNQGYARGIEHGQSQIGTATVMAVDLPEGAQSAGFYAIAYQLDGNAPGDLAGKAVVSYRGTDNMSFMADPVAGASDIVEADVGRASARRLDGDRGELAG